MLAHCYSRIQQGMRSQMPYLLERFTTCEDLFADLQAICTVHVERPYSSASYRCQANDQGALKGKVLFPSVAAGVEQRCNRTSLWIDPTEV